MNKIKFKWFRRRKKKSLLDRTLERYHKRVPVSNNVKEMFKDETPETYQERFRKARERLGL